MARNISMMDFEIANQMVQVDGKWMTLHDKKLYLARKKRSEEKNKRKKARNARLIPNLPPMIKKMVNGVTLIKSLTSFYRNGYRQWGVIANDIIKHPDIERPFILFIASSNDVNKKIQQIKKIGKRDDKDIFQYVEKLFFNLEDLKVKMDNLSEGVNKSGILHNPIYKGKECINGSTDGKRLGLKQLCSRMSENISIMENAIKELDRISFEGCDPMEYFGNGKRWF